MKLTKRRIRLLVGLVVLGLGALGVLVSPAKQDVLHTATAQNPGLYQVVSAADGDTISVKNGTETEKIRFIGVDTPETHDPRKPVQCFAQAASDFTRQRVQNQQVRLEADSQSDNRDRYGRLLRYVYLPDGTLLNLAIVAEGYGFAITGFPHSKMDEFKTAEQTARQQGRGLWNSCQISSQTGYPQTNPVN